MVREYVRDRLMPLTMQVEREDDIPPEVLKEMKELKYVGAFQTKVTKAGAAKLKQAIPEVVVDVGE